MMNYTKRLKGYCGPLLVIYTVVVTLFLAQTAWNDGAATGATQHRRGQAKFLDVLVQEERRHLRSFESIVEKNRWQKEKKLKWTNTSSSGVQSDAVIVTDILVKRALDDHNGSQSKSIEQPRNIDHASKRHHAKKPTFKVEVEEWDAEISQRNSNASRNSSHPSSEARASRKPASGFQRLKKAKVNLEQKVGYPPSETTYSLEYCENVFENLMDSPNICQRDLVMKGSLDYAGPSGFSLPFKSIGDISIYSAFLDHRSLTKVVRLMAIGPRGRDGTKSDYWCVFYRPVGHVTEERGNTSKKLKPLEEVKQLSYWAASAGHNAAQQFYIMTCDVPEEAFGSFSPPYSGHMRVTVGGSDGHAAQSIAIKVINNLPGFYNGSKDLNSKVYFSKMEQELQKFKYDSVKVKEEKDDDDEDDDHAFKRSRDVIDNSDHAVVNKYYGAQSTLSDDSGARRKDRIVACVAPLQGNVGVLQIVEYIELTLLLGSEHLVFYTFRVYDDIRVVLKMYETRGLITVLPWNIPDTMSVWAKGRDAALNDCLYRTMHLFDYALFLDLDEFFVPRATPDMPSFLKYLQHVHSVNVTKYSDIVFSSAYFPPASTADIQNVLAVTGAGRDAAKFLSLKNVHRSYYNQQHTLHMVRTLAAYRVGSGERRRTSFTISTRYASVHHYSHCPRVKPNVMAMAARTPLNLTSNSAAKVPGGDRNGSAAIAPNAGQNTADFCSHTKLDWIMWRYRVKLIERTKQSINLLNSL